MSGCIGQTLFETQVSMTTPGYATARSLCWCHCPCLWGARWFLWTSSWSAVELWDSPRHCWPRPNFPTVWGLQSNLQPPGLSLHWAVTLSSVAMPPAIRHLRWLGSKPQPTQVGPRLLLCLGAAVVFGSCTVKQNIHHLKCSFVQTVAEKPSLTAPSSCPGFWRAVSGVSHIQINMIINAFTMNKTELWCDPFSLLAQVLLKENSSYHFLWCQFSLLGSSLGSQEFCFILQLCRILLELGFAGP